MPELNFEKNNQEIVDVWRDLLKEAILAGCENGFKEKLSNADWKIFKEQPAEIKNYPRSLIDKFALGKATVWELYADFSREDYPVQILIDAYGGDIVETIIIQNENGEYFDLRQLLPEMLYFIKENLFACGLTRVGDKNFYSIIYDKKSLTNSGIFLSFLHEISHARIYENVNPFTYAKIVKVGMDVKFLSTTELLDKYSDEERGVLLQNERNAWAWSIKTMRELRKQGIDLAPKFGKKEIKKWVYDKTRLSSYECALYITPDILRDIRKEKLEFLKNEKK